MVLLVDVQAMTRKERLKLRMKAIERASHLRALAQAREPVQVTTSFTNPVNAITVNSEDGSAPDVKPTTLLL